ncbi:uncharacterized protein LOC114550842 isoform X2 [Perca flavescens]|uniref:uncharacterized protein LOC114550842 isoform X2 n=1 Tax=Perca flavescens TaxID=8167 RepID=UPI00106EA180|nr:uncharacterized protein LOC114550842 isoform X2 [Perca flavescens]
MIICHLFEAVPFSPCLASATLTSHTHLTLSSLTCRVCWITCTFWTALLKACSEAKLKVFSVQQLMKMLPLLILAGLLFKACTSQITGYGNTTADYGSDAYYRCTANPTGVLQVTWQRLFKDDSIENLATYSKRFGQQVNEPYRGKVIFTEASLNSTSITLANVTWADESCYICSFNVYPDGSKRKQTCLTVRGISRFKTEVQVPSREQDDEYVKVVFSCSATGKPAPTIQWDFSPGATPAHQPRTTTVTNSDHTFTSSSNITLQVPPNWKGNVDCLLNTGVTGQRRERIPFSLPEEKEKEEDGLTSVIETQQTVMAAVGEEAQLNCQLMQSKDVLQVTWLKILLDEEKILATYNNNFGQTVNPDFSNNIEFKAGLQNSSIVIRKVTEQDEGCYLCLFNTYPEGALTATTCLLLYELHEPILRVGESISPEEAVVSCSATGRPAPTVTLTVPHHNSSRVTNTNGTVTVTTTAVLPRLHGNSTQVGCAMRVLSGPQIEVFTMIPEIRQLSADDFTLILVLSVVMAGVCLAVIITVWLKRKHWSRLSHRDSEENKTPQKTAKDDHEPKTPLMSQENEVRQRVSPVKKKHHIPPKVSSPTVRCKLFCETE